MGLSVEQRLEPTKQPEKIIAQNGRGKTGQTSPTDRRDPDPEREVKNVLMIACEGTGSGDSGPQMR